jgi:hypothetical protein
LDIIFFFLSILGKVKNNIIFKRLYSMNNLNEFLNNNYLNIGIIILVVVGLLVIISIKGINLNTPVPPTHLVQTVTVETFYPEVNEDMDQLKLLPAQGFCASLEGTTAPLEQSCNELTQDNCAEVGCCVYMRNGLKGKCVAGSSKGPTYKTDPNGQMITADRYYYLGKCYGNCPPSLS